jgi:hypothetical protein
MKKKELSSRKRKSLLLAPYRISILSDRNLAFALIQLQVEKLRLKHVLVEKHRVELWRRVRAAAIVKQICATPDIQGRGLKRQWNKQQEFAG